MGYELNPSYFTKVMLQMFQVHAKQVLQKDSGIGEEEQAHSVVRLCDNVVEETKMRKRMDAFEVLEINPHLQMRQLRRL